MNSRPLNRWHQLRYGFLFLMAIVCITLPPLLPQLSLASQLSKHPSPGLQGSAILHPVPLADSSWVSQLPHDQDLALGDPAFLRPSSSVANGRGVANGQGQITLNQAVQAYQAEQFAEAVRLLQAVSQTSERARDRSSALTYLSLAHQKLGAWAAAEQAIADSLQLIQSTPSLANEDLLLAQALNARAHLLLATGQTETALNTWKQAAIVYQRANDLQGIIGSLVNQSQALQTLGLYQEALTTLERVAKQLQTQPDSALKVAGLRGLGNTLRVIGDLQEAQQVLQESLTIARRLDDRETIVRSLLSLGSVLQARADAVLGLEYVLPDRRDAARQTAADALDLYQQAETLTMLPLLRAQAQLNQFSLLVRLRQPDGALTLLPKIQAQLAALPPSRASIYAQLQLAQGLGQLKIAAQQAAQQDITQQGAGISWRVIAQIAATASKQTETLQDARARSYALGNLGAIYEQTQQWTIAQDLTQQALLLSQSIQANDITYRWHWQSGRIHRAMDDRSSALAAYAQAVETLKSLRRDLIAINPEVQFSFRDSVEPIYREYVSLLLTDTQPVAIRKTTNAKIATNADLQQSRLIEARNAIESLQLAELENFLRQACLEADSVQIDQVDPTAAVFYPVILPDRLEVILSLPNQPLRHYATTVSQRQLESVLFDLRSGLTDRNSDSFFTPAQQVYNWLIRPALNDLIQANITTLVFVLDGSLRNVPMTALHNGDRFVAEQFRVAITPGLQLIDVKPLKREGLKALLAGLTESRQGFSALPNVATELQEVEKQVSSQVLLNDDFVTSTLKQRLASFGGPIVHLATHGEFSSNADDTFVLTWDGRLNINQLTEVLQQQSRNPQQAIELLILSACRTALGDRRAALGLSGMAVRAGARSTIGSLWYVDDAATTELIVSFYKNLTDSAIPKAEALRRAQLTLLNSNTHSHPYFWAPFILVGNWL